MDGLAASKALLCALLALFVVVACGADSAGTLGQLPSPLPSPTPGVTSPAGPSPAPQLATPSPSRTPTSPAPATIVVSFSGLNAGTYPVHLHSACNGAQSFHIAVVQSLVVRQGGSGSIAVASSSFGRGLCLIVYGSPSLKTVLTVRRI
ncbi:MAG: hypothetical protein M3003_15580 [Candidatus Dormibacteraeota bacterium]|nr:hypothetical protein [Candidatus Dormibacteraeota bacterium]